MGLFWAEEATVVADHLKTQPEIVLPFPLATPAACSVRLRDTPRKNAQGQRRRSNKQQKHAHTHTHTRPPQKGGIQMPRKRSQAASRPARPSRGVRCASALRCDKESVLVKTLRPCLQPTLCWSQRVECVERPRTRRGPWQAQSSQRQPCLNSRSRSAGEWQAR